MSSLQSSIIEMGDHYRVFGSSVIPHETLPPATYRVSFDPMSGFSLLRVNSTEVGETKIYGSHNSKLDKVFKTFHVTNRSTGVLLSGDKGMGKSLFLRQIAAQAVEEGIPVVRITSDYPGQSDFIDSLGECVVVFDEFEKTFEEENSQNKYLSLFDGSSSVKRMYVLTVNRLSKTSSFLLDRPGRFHYHIKFNYPTFKEALFYLEEKIGAPLSEQDQATLAVIVDASKINYDHLRAIAAEKINFPEVSLSDSITDLNVGSELSSMFSMEITFSDGDKVISYSNDEIPSEGLSSYFGFSGLDSEIRVAPEDVRFNFSDSAWIVNSAVLNPAIEQARDRLKAVGERDPFGNGDRYKFLHKIANSEVLSVSLIPDRERMAHRAPIHSILF